MSRRGAICMRTVPAGLRPAFLRAPPRFEFCFFTLRNPPRGPKFQPSTAPSAWDRPRDSKRSCARARPEFGCGYGPWPPRHSSGGARVLLDLWIPFDFSVFVGRGPVKDINQQSAIVGLPTFSAPDFLLGVTEQRRFFYVAFSEEILTACVASPISGDVSIFMPPHLPDAARGATNVSYRAPVISLAPHRHPVEAMFSKSSPVRITIHNNPVFHKFFEGGLPADAMSAGVFVTPAQFAFVILIAAPEIADRERPKWFSRSSPSHDLLRFVSFVCRHHPRFCVCIPAGSNGFELLFDGVGVAGDCYEVRCHFVSVFSVPDSVRAAVTFLRYAINLAGPI